MGGRTPSSFSAGSLVDSCQAVILACSSAVIQKGYHIIIVGETRRGLQAFVSSVSGARSTVFDASPASEVSKA